MLNKQDGLGQEQPSCWGGMMQELVVGAVGEQICSLSPWGTAQLVLSWYRTCILIFELLKDPGFAVTCLHQAGVIGRTVSLGHLYCPALGYKVSGRDHVLYWII